MAKIAIVTDSNSGITQKQSEEYGIHVLPMPFYIDGKEYFEDISLTQEQFYEYLDKGADIGTSQPAVGHILDLWDKLLKEYDEIVHIPMSSGLSGSCGNAQGLSLDYDGKVQVVNNKRISVTQRQSVMDAKGLADQGFSAAEIKGILEEEGKQSTIYIMVDTLKYLKKGGRITPAAAAIGTVLNLKPVLTIQGAKLDAFSKCRGIKQAKRIMSDALNRDLTERFSEAFEKKDMYLQVAHTHNEEAAQQLVEELKEQYPGFDVHMDPLSLSVACHIGPGSLAVAATKKLEQLK